MLLGPFVEGEVAPITHTHSQGDIVGAGAGASAANRGVHLSIGPEKTFSNTATRSVYFEVRNGLSARVSERFMIEAWTDSLTPAIKPRGRLSTAIVTTGEFHGSVGTATVRPRDFFFHTTTAGSAIVAYGEQSTITDYLFAELVSPTGLSNALAFTGP